MTYRSTKTYGHEVGLSCCFRQWRADHSHCRFLHGYAISVRFEFEADTLDDRNWVMDFGGLKAVKQYLADNFDHKVLVAEDDPKLDELTYLHQLGVAEVLLVEATGCEAFARMIFDDISEWMMRQGHTPRVRLNSVEVREHGANSAIYTGVGE